MQKKIVARISFNSRPCEGATLIKCLILILKILFQFTPL